MDYYNKKDCGCSPNKRVVSNCCPPPCAPCCDTTLWASCIFIQDDYRNLGGNGGSSSLSDLLFNLDNLALQINDNRINIKNIFNDVENFYQDLSLDGNELKISDGESVIFPDSFFQNLFTRDLTLLEHREHDGNGFDFEFNNFRYFKLNFSGNGVTTNYYEPVVNQGQQIYTVDNNGTSDAEFISRLALLGANLGTYLESERISSGEASKVHLFPNRIINTTQDYTINASDQLFLTIPSRIEGNGALLTLVDSATGEVEFNTDVLDDITDIQGDITNIEGDITTIQGDITTLQGDVSTINTNISNINTQIGDITTDITDLENELQDFDNLFTGDLTLTENRTHNGGTFDFGITNLGNFLIDSNFFTVSTDSLRLNIPTTTVGVGSVLTLTNATTGESEWQLPLGTSSDPNKVAWFEGDIKVTGTIDPQRILFQTGGTSPTYDAATLGKFAIEWDNGLDLEFKSDTTNNILYATNDGNVGIGTDNVTQRLTVQGKGLFKLNNNHSEVIFEDFSGVEKWAVGKCRQLLFTLRNSFAITDIQTSQAIRFIIDEDTGNVGVGGIGDPLASMHVGRDLRIEDTPVQTSMVDKVILIKDDNSNEVQQISPSELTTGIIKGIYNSNADAIAAGWAIGDTYEAGSAHVLGAIEGTWITIR